MNRRGMSLFLSILLLFSHIPTQAFAFVPAIPAIFAGAAQVIQWVGAALTITGTAASMMKGPKPQLEPTLEEIVQEGPPVKGFCDDPKFAEELLKRQGNTSVVVPPSVIPTATTAVAPQATVPLQQPPLTGAIITPGRQPSLPTNPTAGIPFTLGTTSGTVPNKIIRKKIAKLSIWRQAINKGKEYIETSTGAVKYVADKAGELAGPVIDKAGPALPYIGWAWAAYKAYSVTTTAYGHAQAIHGYLSPQEKLKAPSKPTQQQGSQQNSPEPEKPDDKEKKDKNLAKLEGAPATEEVKQKIAQEAKQAAQKAKEAGYTPTNFDMQSKSGWNMSREGTTINSRKYTRHALERMAPDTPQVRAELQARALEKGIVPNGSTEMIKKFLEEVCPRGIPPVVVEEVITAAKPIEGTGSYFGTYNYVANGVRVVLNKVGDVITVHKLS